MARFAIRTDVKSAEMDLLVFLFEFGGTELAGGSRSMRQQLLRR